jgi:transposase InsO family protein
MNQVYKAVGITKQGFHQRQDRRLNMASQLAQMECVVRKIRQDHPKMSSRQIYVMLQPDFIGRDRFEKWCHDLGLKVKQKRNYMRTTNCLGVTRFENRIKQKELTGINQVWVSDITYYRIGERFYYLTFIMDLYSRRIVGYSVSRGMRTEQTTIPALKKALALRKKEELKGLIIHSDGGGQYYSKDFIKITRSKGLVNSMAESVYENPHAERINGTIKNNYLKPYGPTNYRRLIQMTRKAVQLYNSEKPHKAIGNKSPIQYENEFLVN